MNDQSHQVKHAIDAGAAVLTLGSIAGVVPIIGGVLAIVWYLLQIYTWFKDTLHRRKTKTRRKTDRE